MEFVSRFGQLLTHDFCPGANRWVYWLKHPVACLAAVGLAALLFAILLKPLAWVVVVAVAFVLAIGLVWPWVSIRGLSCTVRFDVPRVSEGDAVTATINIRNRWPWPAWGLTLQERLETSFGDDDSLAEADENALAFSKVPGWSTSEYRWVIRPKSFGVYPTEPPRIGCGFPFGLYRSVTTASLENSLLVWPQVTPLETLLDAGAVSMADDRFSDCLVGEFGDLTGTRPFREGDSLRRVHWAQTARHDRLIVCERQAAVISSVEIVLDLHRFPFDPAVDTASAWSVRIAASLACAWHAENASVVVRSNDERLTIQPGRRGREALLDVMARLPHARSILDRKTVQATNAGLQIVVTTDPERIPSFDRGDHTDRRFVLVENGEPSGRFATSTIPINVNRPVPEQFQRAWRKVCHD
ncbi:DUF58 domain-containing protein [Thalassoroseus pseudoceratinae]|uniref:DUF58 domain-containing protein n=1 Tax=Thalassoroseus pseudoceratinae TaxID=2713176 RepID=UPI0014220BF4|nr:DUF58 domain-containing protein [Thalassoroseus pseudoceratinae]